MTQARQILNPKFPACRWAGNPKQIPMFNLTIAGDQNISSQFT